MPTALIRTAPLIALCFVATLMAGCTQQVMETVAVRYATDRPDGQRGHCDTALGGYFLPKTFLNVEIVQVTSREYVMKALDTVRHADNRLSFCLDYLASSFAHDQVHIRKSKSSPATSTQFLQFVASKALDQTSFVARRFVRTVFIGIGIVTARAYTFADLSGAEVVRQLQFDPFDLRDLALVNNSIRQFGFCIVLEGYTYPPGIRPEQYCRSPDAYVPFFKAFTKRYAAYEAAVIPRDRPGLLYRPRAPYTVKVYSKLDPKSDERWLLRKTEIFHMENISPVLALRVDRAVFARKKIALTFEDGTLTDACLFKSSELEEGIKIPLEIVQSIVKLPTEVFQIQYDQVANNTNLLTAERQLLEAQQKHIALLKNLEDTAADNPRGAVGAVENISFTENIAGATPEGITKITAETCTAANPAD